MLNFVLNMLNENAVNSYLPIINALRYSLSNYDDGESSKFKDKNFCLYRGMNLDKMKFK